MTGTVAARISDHRFFAALSDEQRAALAEDGVAVTFTAGQRLFDEGGHRRQVLADRGRLHRARHYGARPR